MAVYTCDRCDQLKDDDWSPCSAIGKYTWICEGCLPKVKEESNEEES